MMSDLARAAAEEQMIPNAAIEASRSIQIAAPINRVWRILVSVSDWERWYSYLKNATLEGPFVAGSTLTYGGPLKHRLHIAKVTDLEQVMLYGTMAGYKGITQWNLRRIRDDHTEVTFRESSSGVLLSVLYSNRKLRDHLQRWLNALKTEAEQHP
jgi:hypothetical protein